MRLIVLGFLVVFPWLFWQCQSNSSDGGRISTDALRELEKKDLIPAPPFSADSALFFLDQQLGFGPRVPNTPGHQACGDYLIATLEGWGLLVLVQDFTAKAFDGTLLKGRNIMARFDPTQSKRVLLAAHWDTRPFADQDSDPTRRNEPFLGANDGASGVAVLLEIARLLTQKETPKPPVGVDLLFFDLEDYGKSNVRNSYCLGSQHWGANKMPEGYSAYYGILLDMVGAQQARFYKESTSMQFAPKVMQRVWQIGQQLGYGQYFIDQAAEGVLDDHYYVNTLAKIPMIDIIEHDPQTPNYFGGYWHTHQDNRDIIDKATLKAVGQTVLTTIYNEN
ncbi:MAG: M28 family peptidase [Bernardetiaceae bacterium]